MTDAVLEGTLRRRLRTLLGCMYGSREDEAYAAVSSSIGRHADQAAKPDGVPGRSAFSEADALLISYGDMIAPPLGDGPEARESALARLGSFLDAYAPGLFSYLHILPFYPYSSDDGFSVKDYRAVNPSLGSWDDVAALGGRRKLAFDLVLNHASAQGQWFRAFLARQAPYDRYFIKIGRAHV